MTRLNRRGAGIIIGVILLLLGVVLGVFFLPRSMRTWTVDTKIGGRKAKVTITFVRRFGIMLGRQYVLGGNGDDEFAVRVGFDDGEHFEFHTNREPKAIWEIQGAYYVCCYYPGKGWLLARLVEDGNLLPIYRRDLPEGKQDWNLVEPGDEDHWQKNFENWAP